MTGKEIIEKLKEANITVENFAYQDWELPELGNCDEVEQHGGEGEGDSWYSIKYFKDHDVYLKANGWYQSHYGTDFMGWDEAVKEVKPSQKTITVYS